MKDRECLSALDKALLDDGLFFRLDGINVLCSSRISASLYRGDKDFFGELKRDGLNKYMIVSNFPYQNNIGDSLRRLSQSYSSDENLVEEDEKFINLPPESSDLVKPIWRGCAFLVGGAFEKRSIAMGLNYMNGELIVGIGKTVEGVAKNLCYQANKYFFDKHTKLYTIGKSK